jgi:hypothetical protein
MPEKLFSMSKVRPLVKMDSVQEAKEFGNRRAFDVLMEAQTYWDNMSKYRRERLRNKRYTYGDQWGDIIKDEDGEEITEEEYIKKQGNVPLKNNLIRRLVKNVLGVYRSQSKEPICTARDRAEQKLGETMSTILQCNMQTNRMSEIYARTMEEYLIGGFVVHRKWYGWRNEKMDCWTDYILPDQFFIDSNMRDFRGWDCECLGEIKEMSFAELCGHFAHTPDDFNRLSRIYASARNRNTIRDYCEYFGYGRRRNIDFLLTDNPSMCRVIEVWRKESKPRYRCHDYNTGDVFKIEVEDYAEMVEAVNNDRLKRGQEQGMSVEDIPMIKAEWFMDSYWYFYDLTPFGDILDEGETPYEHKSHPYVFKAYPYLDGEIHSFVADVIDQQRYTNRLITMYDWIMRASAKGLLMIPAQVIDDAHMSIEEIAEEWSRYNGVIVYKAKPNVPAPAQIANHSTNIGINELLQIQLKFFEDISGVHGALQGRPGSASTSGTLYAQQAQNATTSLLDILDSFSMFVVDAAYKDVKNMQQYYDGKRVFNISGKSGAEIEYDPKKIRDIEFDLSIVESTSTPAYRQMANDFLMEIWKSGQITLQQLLETGSFPFADQLLQSIQSQQEQIARGETPTPLSPQLQQQAQQGANMQAVNQLYGAMKAAA